MKIFISKDNSWSRHLFFKLQEKYPDFVFPLFAPSALENEIKHCEIGNEISHIFFFHWSQYIPESIFKKYRCISFHTSNLPQGRGGSPIQNQILNGTIRTNVNAIKTTEKMDTGPIYCRTPITLQGNLTDIWHTISDVSYNMIVRIIEENPTPIPQYITNGNQTPTTFKRIKNNEIPFRNIKDLKRVYDRIRMRDEDYKSFVQIGDFVLSFSRAKYEGDKIIADVEIKCAKK